MAGQPEPKKQRFPLASIACLGLGQLVLACQEILESAVQRPLTVGALRCRSSLAYHMQQQPSAARVPSGLHSMSTRHLSNAAWHPSNLPQRNNNYVAQFPQSDSQGTGVFLPKPQRPSQSKTRAAKSSAVRQCPSTLSHADSDLSCHSSTTDCIMLLTEACSQGTGFGACQTSHKESACAWCKQN